ncbi:MAG: ornithine cyclodeaminase family protein [Candidatus Acidiferrales bacterium]
MLRQRDFNARLPEATVLEALHEAFSALASGTAVQPPQASGMTAGQVDVIWYPGILGTHHLFGAKLSPYLMQRKAGPRVTAWTLLCSTETGEPVLLCDSLALTTERTAATTALALQLLKPAKAQRLAVIGLGAVALAHLRYAAKISEWSEVNVFSRHAHRDNSILQKIPANLRQKTSIAASAQSAVENSDVILLCTSSTTPVIDHRWLNPSQMVTSLTTTSTAACEIAPEALAGLDVYCDYRVTTPAVAGEMTAAVKNHGWSPDKILGDLPELVSGKCRKPAGNRAIFFRSVGLGIEDIAIASALLRKRRKSSNSASSGGRRS